MTDTASKTQGLPDDEAARRKMTDNELCTLRNDALEALCRDGIDDFWLSDDPRAALCRDVEEILRLRDCRTSAYDLMRATYAAGGTRAQLAEVRDTAASVLAKRDAHVSALRSASEIEPSALREAFLDWNDPFQVLKVYVEELDDLAGSGPFITALRTALEVERGTPAGYDPAPADPAWEAVRAALAEASS